MKKTLLLILLAVMMTITMLIPVAATEQPLVCDGADLLTAFEEAALLSKLESISASSNMDVVVVTVDSIGNKSPRDYADDFYDENGYGQGSGYDGLLLLVSMEECDWYISTCGYAITVFTDAGLEYIAEQFVPFLSDGEYAEAFDEFAKQCENFIAQAKTGDPYDHHNLPKEPFDFILSLGVALVVGYIFGKFYTGGLKSQLKSVRKQENASTYIKKRNMNLGESCDIFMYKNITKTKKESSSKSGSSTHTSSSGRTHGGGGGKF
jgi:uncharacterized protein